MRVTMVLMACAALAACGGKANTGGGTGGQSASGGGGGVNTTGSGGGAGGAGSAAASWEPMKTGATWTYSTTESAPQDAGTTAGTKTVTVDGNEPVPGRAGIMAWRIHTVVPGSEDQLTWQDETATGIVRYRDDVYASGGTTSLITFDTYAPSKLRIATAPERLMTGATYSETYTDAITNVVPNTTSSSSKTTSWMVVSASEQITVPAGTFSTIHLQKTSGTSTVVDKDYWFARGVGKVKEMSDAGRIEMLMSYTIP